MRKSRSVQQPSSFISTIRNSVVIVLRTLGKPLYYTVVFGIFVFPLLFFVITLPSATQRLHSFIVQRYAPLLRKTTSLQKQNSYLLALQSLSTGTIGAVVLGFLGVIFYFTILKDLPSPRELVTRDQIVTTKIYDKNGNILYKIYKDENRTLVPLSSIPSSLKHATIAIEDKDFYRHSGFSLSGIARAVKANIERKKIQGGSTITQQLVKNTLLTPEKTMQRKIREIVLAMMVEATLTKDEILEMYFNEVSFGGSVYGVEEASRRYFNKSVRDLTLAEAAYLAGLPQAPSAYSPFGPTPEYGFQRQHQVLERMVEDGYITEYEAATAQEQKLTFQPDLNNIQAPHFVMYIRDLLAKQFGEEVVAQGGLEVVTTLDLSAQKLAQQAVEKELARLSRMNVTNGAAMVTNPNTGEVLAMVGSRDYFDVEHDGQVNVTLRQRQPGSSIKPLTYAVAFQKGMTPTSVVEDAPITYKSIGSPPYTPKNYDGNYHGKVTIRTALASSYNIPAVKTLAMVGLPAVIQQGRLMGITTWGEDQASRFGLSLTLGGGEVIMADMAKLYGTFATGGITIPLNPIISIKNYKGEQLYMNPCIKDSQQCKGTRTLDPRIAYQITDILMDNNARSSAFGAHSVLNIPKHQVAVKTGTTNSLRDNWTLGYTSSRLVATWVGNNDNSPMSRVASGITGASPIWNTIMKGLLDDTNPHTFASPSGFIKVRVCAQTGTLSCKACPSSRDEFFIPGTEPKTYCTDEMFAPKDPNATPTPTSNSRDQLLQGVTTQ